MCPIVGLGARLADPTQPYRRSVDRVEAGLPWPAIHSPTDRANVAAARPGTERLSPSPHGVEGIHWLMVGSTNVVDAGLSRSKFSM
jgi:hypothetical protein